MRFYGLIHGVDLNNKLISIKRFNKLYFFYFQNSLMHLFKRYLYQGIFIDFSYDENKLALKSYCEAYLITDVYEVSRKNSLANAIFYNKNTINKSLKEILNSLNNILFLDLEMTMPEYHQSGHYSSEIIQAGFYLTDSDFNRIYENTYYISPKKSKKLSQRTIDFLKISQDKFNEDCIKYKEFYNIFKDILSTYQPTIIVYGKNDMIALDNSYVLNNLPSLKEECRFINLNSILKQFYSLKSDPGLFKLYEYFYNTDETQLHDALDDAYVTYLVFRAFLENINNGKKLPKELFS